MYFLLAGLCFALTSAVFLGFALVLERRRGAALNTKCEGLNADCEGLHAEKIELSMQVKFMTKKLEETSFAAEQLLETSKENASNKQKLLGLQELLARFEREALGFKQEKLEFDRKISALQDELRAKNLELIQLNEKLSAQERLKADLQLLLEEAKGQITIQNRDQYKAIHDSLQKYMGEIQQKYAKEYGEMLERASERGQKTTKEAEEKFAKIVERDVQETLLKITESFHNQQKQIKDLAEPVDFFKKILSSSKESGSHGEQTLANQLDSIGLRHGVDYFTQFACKGAGEERLIADFVIIVPNQGKKDVLIIDSKSSTKLGGTKQELAQSLEASFANFSRKDYKTAVEKRLKEERKFEINQTHLFIYLPFDRMLSMIAEEKPDFFRKTRERGLGILTPTILDFLLDSIKLYSAKIELGEQAEKMMEDVRVLIERTSKVLGFVKDLGKSVRQSNKKFDELSGSVRRMFVPIVNKMARPLNVKQVQFEEATDEEKSMKDIKEIEVKDDLQDVA